jgi:sugar lactone lactonase YvrE
MVRLNFGTVLLSSCLALVLCMGAFPQRSIEFARPEGTMSTVAGSGGRPWLGNLSGGMAVDATGNLFLTQRQPARILRLTPAAVVSTAVGNGGHGFAGDGGPAIFAQIGGWGDLAVTGSGDLLIADRANHRIRKVTPDGMIRAVAGSGKAGFGGDGGPAALAQLYDPAAIAVDAKGNLFIADTGNHRIRKVSPEGSISTVAGSGRSGFGGDGGPATSAALKEPSDVVVGEEGTLFIADRGNHRVRKVSPAGVISTIAGKGTAKSSGDGGPAASATINLPGDLVLDSRGNLYVTDFGDGRPGSDDGKRPWIYSNGRVRKITPSGIISTVSGPKPPIGPSAPPWGPAGLAVDALDNLYVFDTYQRLVKIAANGQVVFGMDPMSNPTPPPQPGFRGDNGPASSAMLNLPGSVAVDEAGNVFFADNGNYRVRKVSLSGVITTVAGSGVKGHFPGEEGGSALSARFGDGFRITMDQPGNLLVVDPGSHRVLKVTSSGMIGTVAGNGTPGYSGDGGPAASAQLQYPWDVTVDRAGNVFISDQGNSRVRKVTPSGIISTMAGNGTRGFSGDGGRAISARLDTLYTVAVDDAGSLFIATAEVRRRDSLLRIRKVSPSGMITTIDTAKFQVAPIIAVDRAGNLFGLEWGTHFGRALRMGTSGEGIVVAGGDAPAFNGDTGPIYSIGLSGPQDLAVDGAGNLYIADTKNHRIRKVTFP